MKSEKAKEIIEKYAVGNSRDAAPSMMKGRAVECVELAEQEAEERMRQKSIKAFEDVLYMPTKQLAEECGVSIDRVCEDAGIDYCRQLFIQKLNDE